MPFETSSTQRADRFLQAELFQVGRRRRQLRAFRSLAIVGLVGALAILTLYASGTAVSPLIRRGIAVGWGVAGITVWIEAQRRFRSWRDNARWVESLRPELEQRLLTIVSRWERQAAPSSGVLDRLVADEVSSAARQWPWPALVGAGNLRVWQATLTVSGALGCVLLPYLSESAPIQVASTPPVPRVDGPLIAVEPGNVEIEKGHPLMVVANFSTSPPRAADVIIRWQSGNTQRVAMTRRLDDPTFAASLTAVNEAGEYRVETTNGRSADYRVTVFERPALVQADATLRFPDYTKLPPKTLLDAQRVTAVEGTELMWTLHVNKPLKRVWLSGKNDERLELTVDGQDPTAFSLSRTLAEDARWELHLEDAQQRTNAVAEEFIIRVTPNRQPEVKPTVARDQAVSALEELGVGAQFSDDFGVTRYGVAYTFASQPAVERVLGEQLAGQEVRSADYLLDFEALQAAPDQLLAYHFWAEDTGPDGQTRRTLSEMYFAEVRRFDEVFRQGQAPEASQSASAAASENQQQAEQLLELQKQVVTATWNLLRIQETTPPAATAGEAVSTILTSQETARSQLMELATQLTDDESTGHAAATLDNMATAIQHLTSAQGGTAADVLRAALDAEQKAYQGLLSLRSREVEVSRSNRSSSASSAAASASSQQRQQQLQQLELKDDPNRYESQRQATQSSQQQTRQRELQQMLDRLKDLARRQQDVNRQLQELQAALQLADTPEEKAEIERILKRLRDQQNDLLRDTDEATEQAAQAQNQSTLRSTQRQLDQARQQIQQSAAAAEQGEVAQALAAGTRAERQLEQSSQELREQSAAELSEQLRQLRQQARELQTSEDQLREALKQRANAPTPGLRSGGQDQELTEPLQQQQTRVREMMERMQSTVQSSESAEPLVAQKLYDTYRSAAQQQIDERLQETERLLKNGLRAEAETREQLAHEAITKLRTGVDEAAEKVLGDEVEGLRRAAGTLAELAQVLNQEIAQQSAANREAAPNQSETTQSEDTPGATDRSPPTSSPNQSNLTPSESPSESGRTSETANQPSLGNQPPPVGPADAATSNDRKLTDANATAPRPGERPTDMRGGSRRDDGGETANESGIGQVRESVGSGPITGASFNTWSERLRDVENMLDEPNLRARAAQIRDRARNFRRDLIRGGQPPQWPLLQQMVAQPLDELTVAVEQELARRSGQSERLVPIDQDPVPQEFAEGVRRYFENLGRGK